MALPIIIMLGGNEPKGYVTQKLTTLLTIEPQPLLIAADLGAAYLLSHGLQPDYLIGDADSLSTDIYNQLQAGTTKVIRLTTDKDELDGAAAYDLARQLGADDIHVFAAFSQMVDYTLANLLLPLANLEPAISTFFYSDSFYARLIYQGTYHLTEPPGTRFSLLPLTAVSGLSLTGCRYPLHQATLPLGSSRCLSNQFQQNQVEISLQSGIMLLFVYISQIVGQEIEK